MEQVQLEALHQFAQTAETFCALLENHTDLSDELFALRCAELLAALYHDVLPLPEDDFTGKDWNNCEGANATLYVRFSGSFAKSLFERLDARQHDRYWLYFNPFDSTSNLHFPLYMTLVEIYDNIRSGLELYRLGTECSFLLAANAWKVNCLVHWGQHATDALRAFHEIIVINYNSQPLRDEADDDDA